MTGNDVKNDKGKEMKNKIEGNGWKNDKKGNGTKKVWRESKRKLEEEQRMKRNKRKWRRERINK